MRQTVGGIDASKAQKIPQIKAADMRKRIKFWINLSAIPQDETTKTIPKIQLLIQRILRFLIRLPQLFKPSQDGVATYSGLESSSPRTQVSRARQFVVNPVLGRRNINRSNTIRHRPFFGLGRVNEYHDVQRQNTWRNLQAFNQAFIELPLSVCRAWAPRHNVDRDEIFCPGAAHVVAIKNQFMLIVLLNGMKKIIRWNLKGVGHCLVDTG
jgi:hypothetical protein